MATDAIASIHEESGHFSRARSQMRMDEIEWRYQGNSVRVGMTWHGQGVSVLMLPALSSISTRSEMWPLQERLGSSFTTLAIDWVGFGDRPRPPLRWSPDMYRNFLAYLLNDVVPRPFATIAAGHAAAYCLDAAAARPGSTGRLCLIAPTWRGPLPTMMGRKHPMFAQISRMVDWPVVGDLLYRLNVNRFMVRKMALGHVYAESSSLSEARFEEKLAVTRASGARHSSIRFVAGELDPMATREAFLSAARQVNDLIMVVYGAETPPRSRAEIEALAGLPNVVAAVVAHAKLAVHEEFSDEVATTIKKFLLGA
jgi:pimeloyl-ACP methyl ester carboxylesterase